MKGVLFRPVFQTCPRFNSVQLCFRMASPLGLSRRKIASRHTSVCCETAFPFLAAMSNWTLISIIFLLGLFSFLCEKHNRGATNRDEDNGDTELTIVQQPSSQSRTQTRGGGTGPSTGRQVQLDGTDSPRRVIFPERQQIDPRPTLSNPADTSTQDRSSLITHSLFFRPIEHPDTVRMVEELLRISRQSNDVQSPNHEKVASECCICLDGYKSNDTVCWAKRDECDHIFHKQCAEEWLQNHDLCPLCRSKIIFDVQ